MTPLLQSHRKGWHRIGVIIATYGAFVIIDLLVFFYRQFVTFGRPLFALPLPLGRNLSLAKHIWISRVPHVHKALRRSLSTRSLRFIEHAVWNSSLQYPQNAVRLVFWLYNTAWRWCLLWSIFIHRHPELHAYVRIEERYFSFRFEAPSSK